MKGEAEKISLRHQLITCAVLCALAIAVILLFHPRPHVSAILHGQPVIYQTLIGMAFGAAYWGISLLGSRFIAPRSAAKHIAESYSRLDLSGWNPLWIAAAAGLGEELFFRGALQPLLGIWATSVLFVLLHIRAYRLNTLNQRVLLQSVSIFAMGVTFGYIAIYIGLLAAMLAHAGMHAVGLYANRRMTRVPTPTAA
ncbi:MAG: CPBP family intramembrane glutamic endopeptidase [Dokdonella sp.]